MRVRRAAVLGALILAWYFFSSLATIYNKLVFEISCGCSPGTLTLVQMLTGAATGPILFVVFGSQYHRIDIREFKSILCLSVVHFSGNYFTNLSILSVAPSLTHTIKAAEPVFSVLLSRWLLREKGTPTAHLSLAVIVLGVIMASSANFKLQFVGLITALLSNLSFSVRNVLTKSSPPVRSFDEVNLFHHMSLIGAFISIPFAIPSLLRLGGRPSDPATTSSSFSCILTILAAAITHSLYNHLSFFVLSRLGPVSHSVANCLKRVFIISSAALYFQHPTTATTSLGTALALLGVAMYSAEKVRPKRPKATLKPPASPPPSLPYLPPQFYPYPSYTLTPPITSPSFPASKPSPALPRLPSQGSITPPALALPLPLSHRHQSPVTGHIQFRTPPPISDESRADLV